MTTQQKNNIFWYFIVPTVIGITLIISMSPWFFDLLATPKDRVFTGINRWSTDYYIYLSYVEQGIRGSLPVKLLMTTQPQTPVFAHLIYSIPGFIFGRILGFNSVFIYHLFRALYGLLFLVVAMKFFYQVSKNKFVTLTAFFLTFFVSGFTRTNGTRYLDWLQEQNIIGRAAGPLHYSLGFVFFLLTVLYFFQTKDRGLKKILIFGLFANLTLFSNPFAFLVLGLCFAGYLLTKLVLKRNKLLQAVKECFNIGLGFCLTLPLFFYYQSVLSEGLWGITGMAPKFYVINHPPIFFWETVLSIGPIFFLGIIGLVFILFRRIKPPLPAEALLGYAKAGPIFLIFVFLVPFFLFFFGDYLKIHPLRAFSGFYYLPLALFSAYLIEVVAQKVFRKRWTAGLIIIFLLFLLTFQNYYLCYKDQLFAFTDFKEFSLFSYPSKKQVEALRFLEKNTPAGSGVLALFEATSQIIGFSGNSTEMSIDHLTKSRFFSGSMENGEAYLFLKKNYFKYVYYSYQEKSVGGSPEIYPFIKKIFENEEVKIYRVID